MPRRRSVARLERIALMGIGDAFAEAASGVDDDNGELSTTAAGKRLQEMLLESIPHYFHKEILSECLVSACSTRFWLLYWVGRPLVPKVL